MEFLRKLFKTGASESNFQSDESHLKRLKDEFELTLSNDVWSCKGAAQDLLVGLEPQRLFNVLLEVRKEMKKQGIKFNKICLVSTGGKSLIVCNSTPPMILKTSLTVNEGAELIASIVKSSGKAVIAHKGTWTLTLPK